jgi:transposase
MVKNRKNNHDKHIRKKFSRKFLNHLNYIISIQRNYNKYIDLQLYHASFMINNNLKFKSIINFIIKSNAAPDNLIFPSIFKAFQYNPKIKPFWNNDIKLLSDKLFLPLNNNIIKSDNIPNTFKSDTWFNVDIYDPIIKGTHKFNIKKNSYKEDDIIKCKDIKLYFNKDQTSIMKQIMGTYRYFYNRCVSFFNNFDTTNKSSWFYIDPKDKKTKINIIDIPDKNYYSFITVRKLIKNNYPQWVPKQFQSHLIDMSIRECVNRFLTCLDTCKKNGTRFEFKYKNKKSVTETINLEDYMISYRYNGIFANWKEGNKYIFRNLRTSEKIPKQFIGSSITYHKRLKTFFLNLNYKSKTINVDSNRVCSIDQGIRKPYTIYSPEDVVIIGDNCVKKISKKCKEIDIIQSRINKREYYLKETINNNVIKRIHRVNSKMKYNLKKALHRKIRSVKNLIKELHNKTIKYLTENYKTIILPTFESKKMAVILHSSVARNMLTFSFYKFKLKLMNKAKEKNIKVLQLEEPFTSKTCTKCGNLNYNLYGSEVYNCVKCNIIIDRDMNGARNILLRNYIAI